VWSTPRSGPLYPRERPGTHWTGGWVGPRAGLNECGKSRPSGIQSPDCPARRQWVYRLSYPGSRDDMYPLNMYCLFEKTCYLHELGIPKTEAEDTKRLYISEYTASRTGRQPSAQSQYGTARYSTARLPRVVVPFCPRPSASSVKKNNQFHGAHSKAAIALPVLHVLPISPSTLTAPH